jgi:hypothetical protein
MNFDQIKSLDKDDLLNLLGLETRRTTTDFIFPVVAIFGVGLLVGAGVGMLIAPRPGKELRADLAGRLQRAPEAIANIPDQANEAIRRVSDKVADRAQDNRPQDRPQGKV